MFQEGIILSQSRPGTRFSLSGLGRSSLLGRFLKRKSGASAVEFALIVAPFLVLLIGLFEVAMIFIAMTTMEHGVAEAARRIRTGELQGSGASAESFKDLVCDSTFGILDCDERLMVDVRVFDNFGAAQGDSPLQDGEINEDSLQFDAGQGSDIVLARVFYEWQIITPMIGGPMSNMTGDRRLLQASVAFRNEPFGDR